MRASSVTREEDNTGASFLEQLLTQLEQLSNGTVLAGEQRGHQGGERRAGMEREASQTLACQRRDFRAGRAG